MKLSETQSLFASALDAPDPNPAEERFAALLDGERPSAAWRIHVYRNGVKAARISALKEIYPVCLTVLGERCFKAVARDYVYAHPSLQPDLNLYGEDFAGQLGQALTLPGFEGLDYLPDLARLEWLWHGLYYADDDPVFDAQAFARDAAEDAESIRFQVSASLRLLSSPWPVAELWRRHRERRDWHGIEAGKGDRLAFWRRDLDRRLTCVDEAFFRLLSAVSQGRRLGVMAASGLCVDRLGEAMAQGWIVGYERTAEVDGAYGPDSL